MGERERKDRARSHSSTGPKESELLEKEAASFDAEKTLAEDTRRMFDKVSEYATLELKGTLSELQCLEQMNRVTAAKYKEMVSTAEGLAAFQDELRKKYQELSPVFQEIEQMNKAVEDLEKVANALDAYSKRLEEKAIMLQKQNLKD